MLLQIHELLLPRRKLQVKADQDVEEYYSQCSFGTDGDEKSFLTTWTDGRTDGRQGRGGEHDYAIVGRRIRRIQEKKVDRCSLDLSSSSPILNFKIIVMVVRT